MAYALKYEKRAVAASGLDVLAGICLMISPFVLSFLYVKLATANDVMFGMIVALLAVYRYMNPASNPGVSWFNFALGIWILICPFTCRFATNQNHVAVITNVVMGFIILILSAISATAASKITPESGPGIYQHK